MIQALSAIAPRAAIGLMNIVAASIKRRVTMDINLKPCPFCGNKAAPQIMDQNQALWRDPDYDGDLRIVVCCAARNGGCGASTGFCDNDDEAVAAWNRRTAEDTTDMWAYVCGYKE